MKIWKGVIEQRLGLESIYQKIRLDLCPGVHP